MMDFSCLSGRRDYHTHTVFSDGKDSPEEMVLAAIENGLTEIGISDHGCCTCDDGWCMAPGSLEEYKSTIRNLREKYGSVISVRLGIEKEVFSDEPNDDYDYVIGSVHCVRVEDTFASVDESEERFRENCAKYFGGDFYLFAEEYYKLVGEVADRTGCDIIGHFDLISKYNEGGRIFDESNPRYVKAWQNAADRLLATGRVFEINNSQVRRGLKSVPYPKPEIMEYIRVHGGCFIRTSDSHSAKDIGWMFS